MNFPEQYDTYLDCVENALEDACDAMDFSPEILAESMRYSLLAGGKRVRPVLFFAALDAFGYDYKKEGNFAVAIEAVHTYSLIHDDLPAMDDDDYRRGRPSSHKIFGEANAILAGDALLSYAFDLILKEAERGPLHLKAAQELSRAAGAEGMVAGQSADLYYTKAARAGEKELTFIYERKTARLITAPLVMAATLAEQHIDAMRNFGRSLGMLFQAVDDILDEKGGSDLGKTPGKDREEGKLTAVKVYGIEGAEKFADSLAADCHALLYSIGAENSFLDGIVDLVRTRKK